MKTTRLFGYALLEEKKVALVVGICYPNCMYYKDL